jgi:1,2-phenylacetyl-CoA epoxidase catalytic subunit
VIAGRSIFLDEAGHGAQHHRLAEQLVEGLRLVTGWREQRGRMMDERKPRLKQQREHAEPSGPAAEAKT